MQLHWDRTRDIVTGVALDTAGKTLGLTLWLIGAWLAVAMIVGSVVMAGWLEGKLT